MFVNIIFTQCLSLSCGSKKMSVCVTYVIQMRLIIRNTASTNRQTEPVYLIDPTGRVQVQNSSNIKCKVHKYTTLHTQSANTTRRADLMPTFEFLNCCCHGVYEKMMSVWHYYHGCVDALT